jgi:hypothetical protein
MFSKKTAESKLYGIIGFNQPFDPAFAIVDAANEISRSGYFVDDNAYVKVEYLKDTQDFLTITDEQFNTYLKRLQQSAIAAVCNQVFNRYSYLDRNLLYKNAMNKVNTETLSNGFVGYKIQVSDEKNIAFEIKRVLLNFSGTGNIELFLFNSNKSTPLFSKVITIASDHQEEVLDWMVDNTGDTYKGKYYLGYNTTGLSVTPYKRDYESSDIKSVLTYLDIERQQVTGHNVNTLFDQTLLQGLSQNIGINPDITVYEDYTDLIVQNENLFGYAIYLQMAILCIQNTMVNIRSNRTQRLTNSDISRMLLELEGQSEGDGVVKITGIKPLLSVEIAKIKHEIDKLNKGYFGEGLEMLTLK